MSNVAVEMAKLNEIAQLIAGPKNGDPAELQARVVRALELVEQIAPADVVEGMLAEQMVGTHLAAMECLRRAAEAGQSPDVRDQALRHATRFMALYTQQMAALDKHRGKGQQRVTVEHVHVAAGGQAIVGNIETGVRRQVPPALEKSVAMPIETGVPQMAQAVRNARPIRPNTGPMQASPRCNAATRMGTPCMAPAVSGKRRCRMHGGVQDSGAPKGNRNALKTGLHTAEMQQMRAFLRETTLRTRQLIDEI